MKMSLPQSATVLRYSSRVVLRRRLYVPPPSSTESIATDTFVFEAKHSSHVERSRPGHSPEIALSLVCSFVSKTIEIDTRLGPCRMDGEAQ